MRIYEQFAKEPSNQLSLFGEGEEDLKAAEDWIRENQDAWYFITREAIADAHRSSKKLSMRDYVAMLRVQKHIKCSNNITPALSRIAERDFPILKGRFTKSRSRVDGFVI